MAEVEVDDGNLQAIRADACMSVRRFARRWSSAAIILVLFIAAVLLSIGWVDLTSFSSSITSSVQETEELDDSAPEIDSEPIDLPFNCSDPAIVKKSCTDGYGQMKQTSNASSVTACPDYFRWIYEDLKPWRVSGISRETMESAKQHSHFRLVILKGKVYLEKFGDAYQTREPYTIWGFVQLLRFYPGIVPDVEIMFRCEDTPLIRKDDYQHPNASQPPALFQYCGSDDGIAVIFPDWSFWGWIELNIRPWNSIIKSIVKGNKKTKWSRRKPYAFWKGNPESPDRRDLASCNVSRRHEWGVRVYRQDWPAEIEKGFENSKLEDQCDHRYKIYIEGWGWSVSEKYILACDSMTLFVKNKYYDFFTRGLIPMEHYWPIRRENKCRDLKFAVQWGNKHPREAKKIGRAGSKYVQEDVKMENVYAYMFHLLSEYAKLLRFKPQIPKNAVELCSTAMVCGEHDISRRFMAQSMVRSPSDELPCALPPPYDPPALEAIMDKKKKLSRQVQKWTDDYWKWRWW